MSEEESEVSDVEKPRVERWYQAAKLYVETESGDSFDFDGKDLVFRFEMDGGYQPFDTRRLAVRFTTDGGLTRMQLISKVAYTWFDATSEMGYVELPVPQKRGE